MKQIKKIDILQKRVKWHTKANDLAGVLALADQIFDLNRDDCSELPEPYRMNLLENLEFLRFSLHYAGNELVEAAYKMAEELSNLLLRMTVIEEDEIEQCNNVLHQYFYEKLIGSVILVDKNGKDHLDWRTLPLR